MLWIDTPTCSRQAGQRVGGYLDAIVPLIMHFVVLREESGDDELKESCLQAFEALALRCFREITPYIKEVWSGGWGLVFQLVVYFGRLWRYV